MLSEVQKSIEEIEKNLSAYIKRTEEDNLKLILLSGQIRDTLRMLEDEKLKGR